VVFAKGKYFSEMTRELIITSFQSVCLLVGMASTIFILETLGEPDFAKLTSTPTPMGDIHFLQMVYWLMTTVTTVGYGDYSPTNNMSQITCAVFIVVGVVFFSAKTGALLDLSALMDQGKGAYNGKPKHVVVMGGSVKSMAPSLNYFLMEIFSSDGPDVVCMSVSPKSQAMKDMIAESWTLGRLHYLQGSPLSCNDLKRANLDNASMVFVLGNVDSRNPDTEDQENILRAISVFRNKPDIRLRLLLLRPANKMKAIAVGFPVNMCYALNEIKANLLSQSCRCPGYSTLMMNLLLTDKHTSEVFSDMEELHKQPTWKQMYINGAQQKIVGFIFEDAYIGVTFEVAAEMVYAATGNILLALQDAQVGKVRVYPRGLSIRYGDIGFVVTTAMKKVALHAKVEKGLSGDSVISDYKDQFKRNQTALSNEELKKDLFRFENLKNGKSPTLKGQSGGADSHRSGEQGTAQRMGALPFIPRRGTGSSQALAPNNVNSMTDEDGAMIERMVNDTNSNAGEVQERKKIEGIAAERIVKAGGHILLLACQPELTWQQIIAFLGPLRAPYLAKVTPVLVLLTVFPPKHMWDMFPDVAFFVGSPMSRGDVNLAGAARASKIIMLSGPPEGEEARMADGNGIIVSSTIENILEEAGRDVFTVYEFFYPSNTNILHHYPICCSSPSDNSFESRTQKDHPNYDSSSHLMPRYASGRLFIPSLLGSVYARAYSTPGILELMEAMLMPSRRGQTSFPFLIGIPPRFHGKPYGELVKACLGSGLGVTVGKLDQNTSILPMGLSREILGKEIVTKDANAGFSRTSDGMVSVEEYKQAHQTIETGDRDGKSSMAFAFTNADPSTIVFSTDNLFVVANEGHKSPPIILQNP